VKFLFTITLFFTSLIVVAQTDSVKLVATVKEFHQALVNGNTISINQQTDKMLSYGHSNGWIETKADMIKNLETGYMNYNSIKEDSIRLMINGSMANVRFVADINATLNGTAGNFHLKVLEVWVRKGKRWLLFARQAVK
jgi:hypothetical protein